MKKQHFPMWAATIIAAAILFSPVVLANTPPMIIRHALTRYQQRHHIPGIAAAVYFKGKTYFFTAGVANKAAQTPITRNTIFQVDSITKTFTSTLMMLAIQKKLMQLSDPLVNFLPPQVKQSGGPINKVTLEQLATHTSSLPRFIRMSKSQRRSFTNAGVYQFLENWQPTMPIGSTYLYSNLGYGLLGNAVANAFKQPFATLLHQYILTPLGMKNTFYIDVPAALVSQRATGYDEEGSATDYVFWGTSSPAAAIASNITDMSVYLKAQLGLGVAPSSLTTAMQATHQGYFQVSPNLVESLGWARVTVKGVTMVRKNGGSPGFASCMMLWPKHQSGIIILTNHYKVRPSACFIGRLVLQRLQQRQLGGTAH